MPVSETTELRIGKLLLRVSRVAPVKAVGDDRPSPFAPRPGRGPVKGTDALPRGSHRPSPARKEPPPIELPVTPVVPVVLPLAAVMSTPAPPSEPGLDKTVPVPLLKSRPLPEVPVNTPVTPTHAPGGTQAVPVRPSQSRRITPRETRPRMEREAGPRRPAPPPPRRGPGLPIAVGVVVAAVAALLLLVMGGGDRRARDEDDQPEPAGTGGSTGRAVGS